MQFVKLTTSQPNPQISRSVNGSGLNKFPVSNFFVCCTDFSSNICFFVTLSRETQNYDDENYLYKS
jgi:hypothetical protein